MTSAADNSVKIQTTSESKPLAPFLVWRNRVDQSLFSQAQYPEQDQGRSALRQENVVHLPLIPTARAMTVPFIRVGLPTLQAPLPDRSVAHDDSALGVVRSRSSRKPSEKRKDNQTAWLTENDSHCGRLWKSVHNESGRPSDDATSFPI